MVSTDPSDPNFGLEIDPKNPDFGLSADIPSLEQQTVTPQGAFEEYDALYHKTGLTRSQRERLNTPLREAMQVPFVSPEQATRALQSIGDIGATRPEDLQPGPVEQGITEELGGAISGMTSGEGVASLPLYVFPGTAAPLIEPSVEEIPQQIQDVVDSAQGGNPKEVAANTTKALLNILTTAGVAHGASRAMGPRPGPWIPERPPVSQLIKEGKASELPPPIPPEYAQRQFVLQPEPPPPIAPAPGLEQTLQTAEQAAPVTPVEETQADVTRRVLANRQRILSRIEEIRPHVMQARQVIGPAGERALEAEWADLNSQLMDPVTNPVVHAPPETKPLPGLQQEGAQPLPQELRYPRGGPAVEPGGTQGASEAPGGVPTAEVPPEAAKYGGPEAAREALRQQLRQQQATRIKLKIQKDGGFVSPITLEDIRNFGQDIYEWGMDFHQWAAEMLHHLGRQVAEHLQDIWASIQATAPYRAWEEITGNPDLGLTKPGTTSELSPIQAFRERLRARRAEIRGEGRQLSALGFDPEDTALQAAIGGTYIAEGITDFAKWSAAMTREFGAEIEPHLADLYKAAQASHAQFQQTGQYTNAPTTPSSQEAPIGVRNETLRAREDAGLSTAPPPGIGVSWKDSVNRGNKALDAGADPYKILSDFQKDHLIGHPRLDPVRAWLERLQRANSEAHGALEADPTNPDLAREAVRTQKAEDEFAAAYQPMKTEWSRSGTGMQEERGITDSDLLSQKTAEQTMRDSLDRELTDADKARAAKAVKDTRQANANVEAGFTEALDHAEKAAKNPPMTPDQMKAHFAQRIKELTPC